MSSAKEKRPLVPVDRVPAAKLPGPLFVTLITVIDRAGRNHMCGRYALHSATEAIAAAMGMKPPTADDAPRYNIPPGTRPPNVNCRSGKRAIEHFLWGFRPGWANDDAPRPINARAEKVAESPYFRSAFARHRCLVPANGWFEWKRDGTTKIPYYLGHREGVLLFFAGLFDPGGEEAGPSFAIITHAAADAFKPIHDRMPLVLDPASRDAWLDPDLNDRVAIRKAVRPLDPATLYAYPVSSAVNKPANDYEELLEPIG
ncbi:SOS response-associated peptidase [Methylonatrum kenyense]|uniref:SOS response-associated peptidase n=1 Tax=Methylonatrum kenyense TaxID=455253 RepID=UPI0020BEC390|nr:SOS response-associated peptidase [Methylonatrum kenyense]MCK8515016.1 SOS response-associated peptidase [Methylonatrum kenyense]